MTYSDLFEFVALPAVCLVAAGIIVNRYKRFLQRRNVGESRGEFMERARSEQAFDRHAATQIALPALVNVVLAFIVAWALRFEFGWLAFAYLAVGLWLSRTAEQSRRREDYARLGWLDRRTLQLFFAWFWPALVWRRIT